MAINGIDEMNLPDDARAPGIREYVDATVLPHKKGKDRLDQTALNNWKTGDLV